MYRVHHEHAALVPIFCLAAFSVSTVAPKFDAWRMLVAFSPPPMCASWQCDKFLGSDPSNRNLPRDSSLDSNGKEGN